MATTREEWAKRMGEHVENFKKDWNSAMGRPLSTEFTDVEKEVLNEQINLALEGVRFNLSWDRWGS